MAVQADAAEQAAVAGRNWYACSPGEVTADLHVDPGVGLSAQRIINLREWAWALVPALALLLPWELGQLIARLSASRVSNSPATT